MLFQSIVYGPIHSRRLGTSLGMNISPTKQKFCSFNCIYCECGWNTILDTLALPSAKEVEKALYQSLSHIDTTTLDSITFSGNGEPTMHPQFLDIIQNTLATRNHLCPKVKISVLSNSTQLHKDSVKEALLLCDNRILKLDSAIDETMHLIDQPKQTTLSVNSLIDNLKLFKNNFTLQICFLKGKFNNHIVDNTTESELSAFEEAFDIIQPTQIMMYVIDRTTPCPTLEKIDLTTMNAIAERFQKKGYKTIVCA